MEKQIAHERLTKEEEVRLLEQTMKDENERLLESNKTLKVCTIYNIREKRLLNF